MSIYNVQECCAARLAPRVAVGAAALMLDRPIDQKNANGSRPKSTESGPRFLGSPSADLIFLLDTRGLCIENNITAKKTALTPNWRCAGAAAHFH